MSAVYILCGSIGGAVAGASFFMLGFPLATFILAYVIGGVLSIITVAIVGVLMMSPFEAENSNLMHYDP